MFELLTEELAGAVEPVFDRFRCTAKDRSDFGLREIFIFDQDKRGPELFWNFCERCLDLGCTFTLQETVPGAG